MFLGFSDPFCFIGFITNILYSLTPSIFIYQLKHGVLIKERISIIGILCLFCNGYLYFLTSALRVDKIENIDPLDFCNLIGAYLGFVYLCLYIYYVHYKDSIKKALIYYIILIVSSVGFLILVWNVVNKEINFWTYLFRYMGIIFNILENLPLGFNIIYIIKNKISEKYTLFGAFFGLLNTSAWFAWAFYSCFINESNTEKPYQSFIANIICVCMQITQFVLFFNFRKYNKDEINDNETNDKEEILNPSNSIVEGNKKEGMNNKKETEVYDEFL